MSRVTAIIINYNTAAMTEKVVRRLSASEKNIEWQLIVIDNASSEPFDAALFRSLGAELVLNGKNLGFAGAVNQGLLRAVGEYVFLLNSDVLVPDRCVSSLIADIDDKIAIVGPRLHYPDGRFQSSWGHFPDLLTEAMRLSQLYKIFPGGTFAVDSFFKKIDVSKPYQVDWVSGACMLFRRSLVDSIGSLDDGFFMGVEDIDFCYRARSAGFATLYDPRVVAEHHHGLSSGGTRSRKRLEQDRDGIDYFLAKHFPKRKLCRKLVWWMQGLRMFLID